MAKKTKRTMKRKAPVRSPADSAAGRTNVLLEDMQKDLRMVAEGMSALNDWRPVVDSRLDRIETSLSTVRISSEVHTRQISQLQADVTELKTDVKSINAKLDSKADKSQVDGLEVRVGALEQKTG